LATKRASGNGSHRLEEAMAMLIQNEAAFVGRLAENERRHLEFERETAEHFAAFESKMAEIIRAVNEHNRLLERLPDEIRERIGFKAQA
jgi:hypothetical protein